MKLSILICTIAERKAQFDSLISELLKQDTQSQCEIISICDNKELTIGAKRQKLLDIAKGDFVVYIDDDDKVAPDYIEKICNAIQPGVDSIGFLQHCTSIYPNVTRTAIAHLSNRWNGWSDSVGGYQHVRTPYHKTPIKREIAHSIGFNSELRFGEDHDFSIRLKQSGKIQNEVFIPEIMYYYQYTWSEHDKRYGIGWTAPSETYVIPYQTILHTKEMKVLKVIHNAGFFSCCTIRLMDIVTYYNQNGVLPDKVDSSEQLNEYKAGNENLWELLFDVYLEEHNHFTLPPAPIDITTDTKRELQFSDYKQILHKAAFPFIQKYFHPSFHTFTVATNMTNKLPDLDGKETCAVFYRGNDKNRETSIGSYQEFINKAKEIQAQEPNIRFIVQPDETEFLHAFKAEFPDAIHFEECAHMPKKDSATFLEMPRHQRPEHAANFLASVLIMSNAKHLITHSGNGGLFSVLFRGHSNNVHQYLNGKFI